MAVSSPTIRALVVVGLCLLVLGTLTVLAGILVPPIVQQKLQQGIQENTIWTSASPPDVDARFRGGDDPSLPPMYFAATMWNVSNLEEVRTGAIPVLEQVGPFVYEKKREKLDVLWDSEGRVHFKEWFHYHLLPNRTTLDPTTTPITTLNLALLGVLAQVHASAGSGWQPFADLLMKLIAERAANDTSLHGVFQTRTAHELLWGYDDPLLVALDQLLPGGLIPRTNVALVVNMTQAQARQQAVSVVNTGLRDPAHTWEIEVDRGTTEVTSWPCPTPVQGTDALQFTPDLSPDTPLRVWVGDVFRSVGLQYVEQQEAYGVQLNRYTLDMADLGPDPCHNQYLHGLFNITTPQMVGPHGPPTAPGPTLLVGMPMFCGVDEAVRRGVVGLECDPKKHLVYIDVEPLTGITMRAYQRLQVASQVAGLGATLDPLVPANTTLPLFWAELSSEITQEAATQFRQRVYGARWVAHHLGRWCWLGGSAALLLGVLVAVLLLELAARPGAWPADMSNPLPRSRRGGGGDGAASSSGAAAAAGDEEAAAVRQPLLGSSSEPAGAGTGS